MLPPASLLISRSSSSTATLRFCAGFPDAASRARVLARYDSSTCTPCTSQQQECVHYCSMYGRWRTLMTLQIPSWKTPHAKGRTAILLCLIHAAVFLISINLNKPLKGTAAIHANWQVVSAAPQHPACASPALLLPAVAALLSGRVPATHDTEPRQFELACRVPSMHTSCKQSHPAQCIDILLIHGGQLAQRVRQGALPARQLTSANLTGAASNRLCTTPSIPAQRSAAQHSTLTHMAFPSARCTSSRLCTPLPACSAIQPPRVHDNFHST